MLLPLPRSPQKIPIHRLTITTTTHARARVRSLKLPLLSTPLPARAAPPQILQQPLCDWPARRTVLRWWVGGWVGFL